MVMAKADEEIKKVLMSFSFGDGHLTKSEKRIRDDLQRWHENSDKRKFFIGERKAHA
jgi:hypothetical protein